MLAALAVTLFAAVNPPTTPYMLSEARRLDGVSHDWVPMEEIAPVMARSAVAAEDADFCLHWGFDLDAIRSAIAAGANRGASTISQQVVKNVYLWQGRNWTRKAVEAAVTPAVEALWSKRRILEVYLNVAEWGPGVYGAEAAAQAHFDRSAARVSERQAALLAAVLPNPRRWSAGAPTPYIRERATVVGRRVAQLGPLLDCAS